MGFDFLIFNDVPGDKSVLDENFVSWLVGENAIDANLYYEKLWNYYHNPITDITYGTDTNTPDNDNPRPYRQGQEYGLPPRITGLTHSFYGGITGGTAVAGVKRKEVVIENDIAWRIDTQVDFLFGKPFNISCRAKNTERAKEIETILNTIFQANGGMTFFQSLAMLGGIYGFVDIILRWDEQFIQSHSQTRQDQHSSIGPELSIVLEKAKNIILEAIEAPRAVPVLSENNYHNIDFYVQHYWQLHNQLEENKNIIDAINHHGKNVSRQKETHNVEVISANHWQRYEDQELVAQGINPLGEIPVVHIQNMPMPMRYGGQSDVEPLIGLQDELNTRLSDRASRVTFQSFKMYLGKGIDSFENRAIAPGRMWSTDNPEASIEEFGGDDESPSEKSHIEDIRQALEKASGVASVAAGILTGKVGNLTSAVALKVTLMGLLSKTERKRQSYGQGIKDMCSLILLALDKTGLYRTTPDEREIDLHWSSPLPENIIEKLQEATMKKELGLPAEQIFKELGYQSDVKECF
ncbi:MAG: phage portal protein [Phycisphaerae bacterium]|nr:phage portal protein [Phycisphaerae bacterium]